MATEIRMNVRVLRDQWGTSVIFEAGAWAGWEVFLPQEGEAQAWYYDRPRHDVPEVMENARAIARITG